MSLTPASMLHEYKELPTAFCDYKFSLDLKRSRQAGNPPPPPFGHGGEEHLMGFPNREEAYKLWSSGSTDAFQGPTYSSSEENANGLRWWASIYCYENRDYERAGAILQECSFANSTLSFIFSLEICLMWQMLYRYCARQFGLVQELYAEWTTLRSADHDSIDDLYTVAHLLPHYIGAAYNQGDTAKVVSLIACLANVSAHPNHSVSVELTRWSHEILELARAKLSEQVTARAWRRGKLTPVSDVLALATCDPTKWNNEEECRG